MIVAWWKQVMRPKQIDPNLPTGLFARIADAVSYGMGTPTNIVFWIAVIAGWTLLFIIRPDLQDAHFLPAWFISLGYNMPLNTITTCAELVIGFLIAAAANRVEKRNWELHQHMAKMLQHIEDQADRTTQVIEHLEKIAGAQQRDLKLEETEIREILTILRTA